MSFFDNHRKLSTPEVVNNNNEASSKIKPKLSTPISVKLPDSMGVEVPKITSEFLIENREIINKAMKNEELEQSWFEFLNDPNVFPPKGKRVLPDPAELPNLLNLKSIEGRFCVILLVTQLLGVVMAPETANAASANKLSQAHIDWTLAAMEKIDPIEYLLYKKNEKQKVSPDYKFDDEDRKLIAWNLYHEARSAINDKDDGLESILGVMYSVYERMSSGKYGGDPKSVIYQQHQYSWTLEILKALNEKDIDVKSFKRLGKLVEKFTGGSFEAEHQHLKGVLEIFINEGNKGERISLPKNMNDYHVIGMLDIEQLAKGVKSPATKARIRKADELLKSEDPNLKKLVIKLGRHVHYNSQAIDRLVAEEKESKEKQ